MRSDLGEFLVFFEDFLDAGDKLFEPEFLRRGNSASVSSASEFSSSLVGEVADLESGDDVFWTHGLFRVFFADFVCFGGDG